MPEHWLVRMQYCDAIMAYGRETRSTLNHRHCYLWSPTGSKSGVSRKISQSPDCSSLWGRSVSISEYISSDRLGFAPPLIVLPFMF